MNITKAAVLWIAGMVTVIALMVVWLWGVPTIKQNVERRAPENEASAIASVRTIVTAQITYNTMYPTVGFSSSLAALSGDCGGSTPSSTHACLIDAVLASGTKNGYKFGTSATASEFQVWANPSWTSFGTTRSFCATSDGIVRETSSPQTFCKGTETSVY